MRCAVVLIDRVGSFTQAAEQVFLDKVSAYCARCAVLAKYKPLIRYVCCMQSLLIGELSKTSQAVAVHSVAHSAVRYFDLSHMVRTRVHVESVRLLLTVCGFPQRTKNYMFSFEKALNLKGNSAVFLAYAVARLSVSRVHTAVSPAVSDCLPLVHDLRCDACL